MRLQDIDRPIAAILFTSADHPADALALAAEAQLPGVPLIGCTTSGEIGGEGVGSVGLLVLTSAEVRARAAVASGFGKSPFDAGLEIARKLHSRQARVLILFPDGLTGDGASLLRGAQEILGTRFVIAGAAAGDRGRFDRTWQICNGRAYSDAVVGLMLESDRPLGASFGVLSGWRALGTSKTVTRAEGNVVHAIDDRRALDLYDLYLGDKAARLPEIGAEYPLALVDDAGRVGERALHPGQDYHLLRTPLQVQRETGAVTFSASIPQGAQVKLARAHTGEVVEAAREAAARARRRLDGRPEAVLFFSSMAIRAVLGRRAGAELEAAREVFGAEVPLAGCYGYGEIANCGEDYPLARFHTGTASFLALRER